MAEESMHSEEWIEVPPEALKDLELPKGEAGDVKGGAAYLKYAGGQYYVSGDISSFSWGATSIDSFSKKI
jgi:hypothetical protein